MREPSRNPACAPRCQTSKGYAGILRIGDLVDLVVVPCYDGTSQHRSFAMNPDICVSMCPHGPGRVPADYRIGSPVTASRTLVFGSPMIGSPTPPATVCGGLSPPAPRAISFPLSGCRVAASS